MNTDFANFRQLSEIRILFIRDATNNVEGTAIILVYEVYSKQGPPPKKSNKGLFRLQFHHIIDALRQFGQCKHHAL